MPMKRTNVYADPEDLALIKQAAARRGIAEAEIIREGVKLAALGARVWDEPLISDEETVDLGRLSDGELRATLEQAARSKSERTGA
ncbi:MAG TPA: CopG family transcriptional regulator [Nocardioidaceae bacterium]|nr:CopG family transcriptional regulator [Nocardioidaceae bacterium]